MFTNTTNHPTFDCPSRPWMMERRWKSNVELAPNCPRCASSKTKFCYYNNYSLSQPRYFCKGCRRYWTKGGSLRNVPVGGGCRKNRRSRAARLAERLGMSCQMPSPGSTSNDSSSRNSADGVNIDLAAVFAKFLNQDSSSTSDDKVVIDQESSSGTSSASTSLDLPPSSMANEIDQLENFMFDCQKPSDFIGDHGLNDQGLQEILDHGCNSLELQAILGDHDIVEDISWSDSPNFPNFGWQNVVQFQDFGSFPTDDHTKITSTVACDNWSLFDLSSYEIFSRP